MTPTAIFGRYARALADVVMEQQEEPRVTEELKTYREIFQVPDLLPVLHSPAVPRETKRRVLDELMARYPVSSTTANFLRVMLPLCPGLPDEPLSSTSGRTRSCWAV